MKNLFLLFITFLFLQITSLAQDGWVQQTSGTTEHLNSVTFVDHNFGWAVGRNGVIVYTSNGGDNWTSQQSPTSETLNTVHFINNATGWICGESVILNTTNSGANWSIIKQATTDSTEYYSVYFVDENIGWIGEYVGIYSGSILYKTTDGGLSWTNQYSAATSFEKIRKILFLNQEMGWILTDRVHNSIRSGKILKTTNGGASWILQYERSDIGFISIDFENNDVGWILGQHWIPLGGFGWGTYILKTTTGGNTWEEQEFWYGELTSNCFSNMQYGWIVGRPEPRIYVTFDGGENWSEQNSPVINGFSSVHFTDSSTGWIVGWDGGILKTINAGVSSIEENELGGIPNSYKLSQNYPNPFNPSTKIQYSVPQASNVIIKVFDILGNEIETLVNEEKQTGTYEISWYAENLPSGVYFYRLKAADFVETKKMTLLK